MARRSGCSRAIFTSRDKISPSIHADTCLCGRLNAELIAGGGKLKVPCLRVGNEDGQTQWIYESGEIIGYLENSFVVG